MEITCHICSNAANPGCAIRGCPHARAEEDEYQDFIRELRKETKEDNSDNTPKQGDQIKLFDL